MENRSLIVGLGNPGREYAGTRHNAGFMAADVLVRRLRLAWRDERKFSSQTARLDGAGGQLIVCKPQTFMNVCGEAVGPMAGFYKILPGRILVMVDDADLPLGEIRLRARGSSGGHHGIESIEEHLGTRDFPRLRIGIGRMESAGRQIAGYVLGQFPDEELTALKQVLDRVTDQAECWLSSGVEMAMNRFNGTLKRPKQEKETE
ncbi:MAG: aminoacyl-tRNA hydrolase [Opitutaceae bacterium]|nr:aminoacyl-tRNA hydrolase [Verrucomicrobiales bacterium]